MEEFDLMMSTMDYSNSDEGDVYFQLAEKEKFLFIAAEAGNALLKQNIDLRSQLECMEKEYCSKIDELEKELYVQKKHFQEGTADYESEIHNLTLDIEYLNKKISKMELESFVCGEKQNTHLKIILGHNESLQNKLNQATSYNTELSFQVNTLKRRIEGRTSFYDNSSTLDQLQYDVMGEPKFTVEQIRQLEKEKKDLEEAVSQFASEKILLFQDIEKSKNYIVSLEQKVKDFQQQINIAESDLSAAKMSNSQLRDQLEEYIMQASFNSFQNNNSLMNELETSLSEPGLNLCARNTGNVDDENQANIRSSSPKLKRKNVEEDPDCSCTCRKNSDFYLEKQNRQAGLSDSSHKQDADILNQQIFELNHKLNKTLKDLENLLKQYNTTKNHLKEVECNAQSLQQQVSRQEREIEILKQERKIIFGDSLPDALKQAIDNRAEALQRESSALLQLDQAKCDMIKLNNQLLEAVQQKLQLSEQLELWQADMATLLERQLHRKPGGEKNKDSGKTSKIFSGRWSWSSNTKLSQQLFGAENKSLSHFSS